MKKIELSEGVYTVELDTPDEEIRWDASFFRDEPLTELYIPDGAQRIAEKGFIYCRSLKKIRMPASISYLGHAIFYGTYSEIEIIYEGTSEQFKAIAEPRKVQKEVQVPGAYDHQPYNNTEGTYYTAKTVTEYFDSFCTACTVTCADGVQLYYGSRRPNN